MTFAVGEISMLRGEALVIRHKAELDARIQMKIQSKDMIQTKKGSKIQLTFKDKTVITLGENTIFSVEHYLFEDKKSKAKFNVKSGSFKVITGKIGKLAAKSFLIKTKTSLIGIRGTVFSGQVGTKKQGNIGDYLACLKGGIIVSSIKTGKTQDVSNGEMIFVNNNGVLGKVEKINRQSFTSLNQPGEKNQKSNISEDIKSQNQKNAKSENANKNSDDDNDSGSGLFVGLLKGVQSVEDREQDIANNRPDISSYIKNETKVNYAGNLEGTSKVTYKTSSSTTEVEASINADMNMQIDFGDNDPLKVDITNQKLTLEKVNGLSDGDTFNQTKQNLDASENSLSSSMQMKQILDTNALTVDGSYKKEANGLESRAELKGKFNDKYADKLDGTLKETTKGTANGIEIDRSINSEFKLEKQ